MRMHTIILPGAARPPLHLAVTRHLMCLCLLLWVTGAQCPAVRGLPLHQPHPDQRRGFRRARHLRRPGGAADGPVGLGPRAGRDGCGLSIVRTAEDLQGHSPDRSRAILYAQRRVSIAARNRAAGRKPRRLRIASARHCGRHAVDDQFQAARHRSDVGHHADHAAGNARQGARRQDQLLRQPRSWHRARDARSLLRFVRLVFP